MLEAATGPKTDYKVEGTMLKGGSAIYCPSCKNHQTVGRPGEKLDLPLTLVCDKCGTTLELSKSQSMGVHVAVQGAQAD